MFQNRLLRSWIFAGSHTPEPKFAKIVQGSKVEIPNKFDEFDLMWCLDYGYNPKVFIAVAVINCRGLAHAALQRPERKRWLELRGFLPSGDLNLWFRGLRVLGVPLEELCVLKSRNNSIR